MEFNSVVAIRKLSKRAKSLHAEDRERCIDTDGDKGKMNCS